MMDAAWAQAMGTIAQVFVGFLQCGLIWIGLNRMQKSSEQRDRQLDLMERRIEDQHEAMMELLRRTEPKTE